MPASWRAVVLGIAALGLAACGSDPGKWDRLRMSNHELDRVQAGQVGWEACTPGADCAVSILDVVDQRATMSSSSCGSASCTTSTAPSATGPTTMTQSYTSSQTSVTQIQILPPGGEDAAVKAAQDAWSRRSNWLLRPR